MGFWGKLLGTKPEPAKAATQLPPPRSDQRRIETPSMAFAELTERGSSRAPTGSQRVPARPVGTPVSPWASETLYTNLVGESHYASAFRAIFKERGLSLNEDSRELPDASAHLAIDPGNPYDPTAVAVWVSGHHVGYLPKDTAAEYFPALDELATEGNHLCVSARVWASAYEGGDFYASGNLQLPPRSGIQPFNQLPEEPSVVIPPGRLAIQVTGEEAHMDLLGRYVADQPRYLAVTLHLITVAKTPRSTPYEAVEVRLDGQRVGELTKAMSAHIRDLVERIDSHGKVPVCRAVLKGSPLRAEVTLDVARSAEVTSTWLDSIA